MPYSLATVDIPLRDPDLPWAENGPGLHPDETVFELDTGELVAASVELHLPTTAGLAMHGWARLIEADGSSKEVGGKVVETSLSFNAQPASLAEHGEATLAKEVLLAVLGEPATSAPLPAPEGAIGEAQTWTDNEGNSHWTDPGASEAPLLNIGASERQDASIRMAIAAVASINQGIDAKAVLGL